MNQNAPRHPIALPTKGETSFLFYFMLVTGALSVVAGLEMLIASSVWIWIGIAAFAIGALGLVASVRMASLKVLMTGDGFVFRWICKERVVYWQDIQCIRFKTLPGRYGQLVIIAAPRRRSHFILDLTACAQIKEDISARCARAVIADEDTETLLPPKSGNSNWRKGQVQKFARQMVKARALSNGTMALAVLLIGAGLGRRHPPQTSVGLVWTTCLLIIGLLAWDVYQLAKRLWI
jgi:hypothetical protein